MPNASRRKLGRNGRMEMRSVSRRLAAFGIAVLGCSAAAGLAHAQAFPTGPVRIVVPYNPGGAVDGTARLLASEMSKSLGKPVIVENRPGASGIIAVEHLKRSPADGYTMLIDTIAIAVNPVVENAPYDAAKDFTPIAQVMAMPYVVAVGPKIKANTLQELIAELKKEKGAMNSTSSGTGSRLASEFFRLESGTDFTIIPYPGAAPAILAVLNGEGDLVAMDMANIATFITSGKLRGLAVSTPERSAAVPNVPSAMEAGLPGYDVRSWFGLFAPKGTPPEIAETLNKHVREALKTEALQKLLKTTGAEGATMNAAEFGTFYRAEVTKWGEVLRKAGLASKPK
jgi:tripartite-type tricarboxylate transporter receptor subunit TctC